MLPPATVPGAAGGVTPPDAAARDGREQRAPRDAATGRAEVMAMPAICRDAGGWLTELPWRAEGSWRAGRCRARRPPGQRGRRISWRRPGSPGSRDRCGRGRAGARLGGAHASVAGRGAGRAAGGAVAEDQPRLAVQIELARALMPGTAAGTLRTLAQRPREADPVYDLPASSSLSDADSSLGVRPLVNLLAGLCGQVRAVPLPGAAAVCLPAAGTPGGQRTAVRLRPLEGGPWSGGRWHALRVLAKDGTVRNVADPKGSDRKGTGGQSRNAAHFGRPASTGAPADPQIRMVEVTDVWWRGAVAWAAGPCGPGRPPWPPASSRLTGPVTWTWPTAGSPAARPSPPRSRLAGTSPGGSPRRGTCAARDGRCRTAPGKRRSPGAAAPIRSVSSNTIDQVFDVPPGHPLLTAPPAGPSVRILDAAGGDDDGDGGLCLPPDGTIRVEVSETVTIITSLMDTIAYPARDIAELYGMRWASELVYLEEKRTRRRAARHRGHPGRGLPDGRRHRRRPPGAADRRASIAAAIGAEPARISATALRCAVTASIGAGQGATASALSAAIEITRRDITAHPLRLVTAWRPGRHYPRFTIKKVRARKSNDVVPAATRLHLLPLPATPGSQQPNAPPAA